MYTFKFKLDMHIYFHSSEFLSKNLGDPDGVYDSFAVLLVFTSDPFSH